MTTVPSHLRKAAILISTLDAPSADAVLDKMPVEIADQVRQLVFELDDVSDEEQEEVIEEFMNAGGHGGLQDDDGVELDPSLQEKLSAQHDHARSDAPEPYTPQSRPFSFLRDATSDAVARHLERQHPQVIAVVAAHLSPTQAAAVVRRLAPKLQADVLKRIAELDTADLEVIRDVEAELELLLSDEIRAARNRHSGIATVKTILNAAGSGRRELLQSLSHHQRSLATELRTSAGVEGNSAHSRNSNRLRTVSETTLSDDEPAAEHEFRAHQDDTAVRVLQARAASVPGSEPPSSQQDEVQDDSIENTSLLEFDELSNLGDEDWAVLIRAADPSVVLLALTGASEQLLKRITQQLPKAEVNALRTKLNHTGPLRLSDIEQAQRHIAMLAGELAAHGQIQLPAHRGFAAAA